MVLVSQSTLEIAIDTTKRCLGAVMPVFTEAVTNKCVSNCAGESFSVFGPC